MLRDFRSPCGTCNCSYISEFARNRTRSEHFSAGRAPLLVGMLCEYLDDAANLESSLGVVWHRQQMLKNAGLTGRDAATFQFMVFHA